MPIPATTGAFAIVPCGVELSARGRSGDNDAISSSISEATGGAGSLNDQSLYPAAAADDRFCKAIKKIEGLARTVAHERGIILVR